MALKLFSILRIPIAVFCLLGYASANRGAGAWATLGAYALLAYVSVQLWRARPGALWWAGLLLALETVGAVLFLLAADIMAGKVEAPGAVLIAALSVAVWTLPNTLCLYALRGRFVVVPETQRLPPIEDRETARLKK